LRIGIRGTLGGREREPEVRVLVQAHLLPSIEAALAGVGTVMVCVTDHDLHLLRAAISRGLGYTDIAPRLAFIIERVKGHGSRVDAFALTVTVESSGRTMGMCLAGRHPADATAAGAAELARQLAAGEVSVPAYGCPRRLFDRPG
jgi:hypothetical protein